MNAMDMMDACERAAYQQRVAGIATYTEREMIELRELGDWLRVYGGLTHVQMATLVRLYEVMR